MVEWSGGQLTAAQLQARVVALKTAAGLTTLDAERAGAFADQAIRSALLATEARARGLESDPVAEGPLAELLARTLIERELEDPARREKLSEEEISAWYAAHKDEFQRTELIRLADIVGTAPKSNGAQRQKVRAEFQALKKKLEALAPAQRQEPFAEAARKRSDDKATGPGGGDLGNLSREQLEQRLGPAAAQAAWLMVGVGQLELFETDDGFHLMMLETRTAGASVPLEQARSAIESRIHYERRERRLEQLVKDLEKKLALSVDEAELKKALAEVK